MIIVQLSEIKNITGTVYKALLIGRLHHSQLFTLFTKLTVHASQLDPVLGLVEQLNHFYQYIFDLFRLLELVINGALQN